ncbi:hypothetical protein LTS18_013967 [Coniosporium uncinatum]|uniref:Uncharacterized protein n=1 Tax=Coniosporium uncinatum TaxID=93489 RepID=A0ACC3D8Z7_9PEZI|nr:hypothetical protein LTS18_013967 [Coniosporium uncinatum]
MIETAHSPAIEAANSYRKRLRKLRGGFTAYREIAQARHEGFIKATRIEAAEGFAQKLYPMVGNDSGDKLRPMTVNLEVLREGAELTERVGKNFGEVVAGHRCHKQLSMRCRGLSDVERTLMGSPDPLKVSAQVIGLRSYALRSGRGNSEHEAALHPSIEADFGRS